MLLKC